MRNRFTRFGWLAVAVVFLGLSSTLCAQEPTPPSAKTAGQLVQLSLIVTDSTKKSINSLSKDEVRVFEGKAEQTVLSIEADARPVDLVLVIDASNSLNRLMAAVLESARVIVVNRRPEDEILIERFIASDNIDKVQDFTRDGDALLAALKSIRIEGGQSAIIDALYLAAGVFADSGKTSTERRRVVVIITDGEDRNSYYRVEQLINLFHETDVQVFALGLVTELDKEAGLIRRSPKERAETLLKTVAEETGGRAFFPKNKPELLDSMAQLIGDLHAQFRLTYESTNGDKKGFRKVEVKLISPKGVKRTAIVRRGYQVGSKKVSSKTADGKSP